MIDLSSSKYSIKFSPRNRLLTITYHDKVDIDIEDVKQMQAVSVKFTSPGKYAVLHIGGEFINVTPSAREEGSKPEYHSALIGQAFLVKNLAQKILGNFIIMFHKPLSPTRIFYNKSEAIRWLDEKTKAAFAEKVL